MVHRDTSVPALCRELGISPVTLYRYVGPQGELRQQGQKVLAPETEPLGRNARVGIPLRTVIDIDLPTSSGPAPLPLLGMPCTRQGNFRQYP